MTKKKNKSSSLKSLFLDRPTSHGGWPDGHPGSFTDPSTPVYKQIANYLKAMGLIDEDNPRARLSENKLRGLIRCCISEALSPNMPKRYYRYRAGIDDDTVKKLEDLEALGNDNALQAHELAVSLGSEEPPSIDAKSLSGIDNDDLDSYVYDAISDIVRNELYQHFGYGTRHNYEWEDLEDYFSQEGVLDDMVADAIDQAVGESLDAYPGDAKIRRMHIMQVGNDPQYYSRLSHDSIMDDVKDWFYTS